MVFSSRTALLLLMAAGIAQAETPSPAPVVNVSTPTPASEWRTVQNTAFTAGEDLRYVVKWGIVVAGYSNLTVVETVEMNQRPTYHIVSSARSGGMVKAFYKVNDRNEVWLDQQALITLRYDRNIHEGKYRVEETSYLDQVNHRWKTQYHRLDKNIQREKEGEMPLNVLDAFGSLYYVRTLPLEVGQTYTMDVHNSSKVYPLVVNVVKKEKIKVPAGKFECIVVEPHLRGPGIFIAKGKKLQVWLTADPRRIPVRMRCEVFIGHVSAELLK